MSAAFPTGLTPIDDAHLINRAHRGQSEAESLDAITRLEHSQFDGVVDALHQRVAVWRRRVAADPLVEDAFQAALQRVSADPPPAIAAMCHRLARSRRRRAKQVVDAVSRSIRERRELLGAQWWDALVHELLRHLLIALWPDTIDRLEVHRTMGRIGYLFGSPLTAWVLHADRAYRDFEHDVAAQWVAQLALARIELGSSPDRTAESLPTVPSGMGFDAIESPHAYVWGDREASTLGFANTGAGRYPSHRWCSSWTVSVPLADGSGSSWTSTNQPRAFSELDA